jgi:hypothetical protein
LVKRVNRSWLDEVFDDGNVGSDRSRASTIEPRRPRAVRVEPADVRRARDASPRVTTADAIAEDSRERGEPCEPLAMRHLLAVLLALSITSVGCHADEPAPEGGASVTSGAEAPSAATRGADAPSTAATDPTSCPADAAEFGAALVAIAAGDVPAPSAEDPSAPVDWTPEWRAWNSLQSAPLRVPEGESVPGAVMRHRLWVHALRAHHAALESGAFTIDQERETEAGVRAFFHAGSGEGALTVQVLKEDGCWHLDDR